MEMLDQHGVSLIEQHITSFIYCHGTQTMHVAIAVLMEEFVTQRSYIDMG